MKEKYTVFFIFDLQPIYFYLWVNFIDLIYNNFNMQNGDIIEDTGTLIELEKILVKSINIITQILFALGILTFFIYIYKQTYKTVLHKGYVMMRFFICFSRTSLYFITFLVYLKMVFVDLMTTHRWFNFITSGFLLILEINDVIWCFYLR